MKSMPYRKVAKILRSLGCTSKQGKGDHVKWYCPDGTHMVPLRESREVSPGVLRDAIDKLACLPEGWWKG